MNCAKCGREIEENQVFCPDCLKGMEDYPVKPGIVVHIPKRADEAEEKKNQARRRAVLTPEEQLRKLKKKLRWLRLSVAVLLLACGLLCFAMGKAVVELDFYRFLGQNYSTVDTAPASRTPSQP